PLLGICLGMQLLARSSEENGHHDGLGLVRAEVKRLPSHDKDLRLPHMGWNEVRPASNAILFKNVPSGADFYFVHSFQVVCDDDAIAAASCQYGNDFCCAIQQDNVFGVQFHPEKSQKFGRQILLNFVQILANGARAHEAVQACSKQG
ncbi:MAG: imidazole glycerol phosphate synthase subunit HisH, partial [Phycisphaerales bacterium]|nr:imidazole glycerol phosphate synthase subunit HisH [Phycisphaerales bacterium]